VSSNGVKYPIPSLVVLSRVACVYWRACRLPSDDGETGDMIDENLSPSVVHDRTSGKDVLTVSLTVL